MFPGKGLLRDRPLVTDLCRTFVRLRFRLWLKKFIEPLCVSPKMLRAQVRVSAHHRFRLPPAEFADDVQVNSRLHEKACEAMTIVPVAELSS